MEPLLMQVLFLIITFGEKHVYLQKIINLYLIAKA